MPRPRLAPRRDIHLRIPEETYAELILLRPDLQATDGYTKYGAISAYFIDLLRKDLETLKTRIRAGASSHG